MKIKVLFPPFVLFISANSLAQTPHVGLLENTDELFRRQQLLGKDTSNASFMIRPL